MIKRHVYETLRGTRQPSRVFQQGGNFATFSLMNMPTKSFVPRLDVLPPAQAVVWQELGEEMPASFTLYGGTALALHLGHRQSVDFDFFGAAFDPDMLHKTLPFLDGAEVVQRAADTLTVRVDRGGPVLVSFFGVPELGRVEPALRARDNGLLVAGLLDIAGMKASVVQKRAAAKDYVDLAALITAGVNLSMALAAGRAIYGNLFNPQITLKALSYFDDVGELSTSTKATLQNAVRMVDLNTLPTLTTVDKIGSPP